MNNFILFLVTLTAISTVEVYTEIILSTIH